MKFYGLNDGQTSSHPANLSQHETQDHHRTNFHLQMSQNQKDSNAENRPAHGTNCFAVLVLGESLGVVECLHEDSWQLQFFLGAFILLLPASTAYIHLTDVWYWKCYIINSAKLWTVINRTDLIQLCVSHILLPTCHSYCWCWRSSPQATH